MNSCKIASSSWKCSKRQHDNYSLNLKFDNLNFESFSFLFFLNTQHTVQVLLIFSCRSSPSEMFLGKYVLKICSKFTGENPCRCAISIKLLFNFIEVALRHGFSPVNLLHISIKPFPKNTSKGLLLFSYQI